jgi:hypothetical protein
VLAIVVCDIHARPPNITISWAVGVNVAISTLIG